MILLYLQIFGLIPFWEALFIKLLNKLLGA